LLQQTPVKTGPRIKLAAWRYMFVPHQVVYWELLHQVTAQRRQLTVLGGFERVSFKALEFDADGKVIAVVTPEMVRDSGMPCACLCADKLHQETVTPDEKMRGHL
jgi:hypothetical protein